MQKFKYIFFLLPLMIFSLQFDTAFAQQISNSGVFMTVPSNLFVNDIKGIMNTTGSIQNDGTLIIKGDITNNASISGNGTYSVTGNFTNNSVFTSNLSTVNFDGIVMQTIGGTATTIFNNLEINNSNGVSLGANTNVAGSLKFTSGVVSTGTHTLSITSTGSVTGAGTSKFVNGSLQKHVATGSNLPVNFEIGSGNTEYLPLNLKFANVSTAGNITAIVKNGDHPLIAISCVDSLKSVNKYWSLSNSGTAYTTYSATATFTAADIDAGSNPANYFMNIYNSGSWISPSIGNRTATSTQGTGISTMGDLQIGEKQTESSAANTPTRSERCVGAGTVSYSGIATGSAPTSYTLDATSIAAGNFIHASSGILTYKATYVGTSTITATTTGCLGPVTFTHFATTVQIPTAPLAIAGDTNVAGKTNNIIKVRYTTPAIAGVSSYVWTAPANATITSGQGSTSIDVTFALAFTTGDISVAGHTACGTGPKFTRTIVNDASLPLSVDNVDPITTNVYPVPATDQFTIEYDAIKNIAGYISVISYDGKEMFRSNTIENTSTQQKLSIDCEWWSRGMYFVTIRDKNNAILLSRPIVLID